MRAAPRAHYGICSIPFLLVIPLALAQSSVEAANQEPPDACPGVHVSHPVWSPDGARIAFLSDASGSYELYLFDIESRGIRALTDNESFEGSVSWAPTSDNFVFWAAFEHDNDFEGYRYDLASGELSKLVAHPENDFDFDWSPEGTRILFQSERDGNREIYVLELLTGETRRLTTNESEDLTPDWSPDGTRFAFSSDRSGRRQIYVMELGSETATAIEHQPDAANYFPVWDPFGRRILVTSRRDDAFSLHLVNPATGSIRTLAEGVSSGPSTWSRDGRVIAYSEVRGAGSAIRLLDLESGDRHDLIDCAAVRGAALD